MYKNKSVFNLNIIFLVFFKLTYHCFQHIETCYNFYRKNQYQIDLLASLIYRIQ